MPRSNGSSRLMEAVERLLRAGAPLFAPVLGGAPNNAASASAYEAVRDRLKAVCRGCDAAARLPDRLVARITAMLQSGDLCSVAAVDVVTALFEEAPYTAAAGQVCWIFQLALLQGPLPAGVHLVA